MKQSGPAPVLVKAEVPWSAKRGALSDKDRVLKSVKGYCQTTLIKSSCTLKLCVFVLTMIFLFSILNKLTPEKYELLKGQLMDSGITSADILKVS